MTIDVVRRLLPSAKSRPGGWNALEHIAGDVPRGQQPKTTVAAKITGEFAAAAAIVPALAGGVRALAPRRGLYDCQLEVMGALSELAFWHENSAVAGRTIDQVRSKSLVSTAFSAFIAMEARFRGSIAMAF